MSDVDPELKAVLAERGEGVRVGAGLADRAIARDRSNRHRELGVAALGAGLVLAVAVPLTWSAVTPTGSRPLPVGPSQSTSPPTTPPSPSPSTSASTPPSTSGRTPTTPTSPTAIPTLRSTGSPSAATLQPATGPATGVTDVGFVVDGVYREGQRQTKLSAPFQRPDRVAALGDGLLITVGDRAVVVDAAGRTLRDLPTLRGPLAVAADRSHGLVTDETGNLLYLDSRGKQVARLAATRGGAAGWQAAGLVGNTAYAVNTDQTSSVAWDVLSGRTTTIKGAIGPIDDAGRRSIVTAGLSPGQPGYGCQRLVDLTSGRAIWNLCGPPLVHLVLTRWISPAGAGLLRRTTARALQRPNRQAALPAVRGGPGREWSRRAAGRRRRVTVYRFGDLGPLRRRRFGHGPSHRRRPATWPAAVHHRGSVRGGGCGRSLVAARHPGGGRTVPVGAELNCPCCLTTPPTQVWSGSAPHSRSRVRSNSRWIDSGRCGSATLMSRSTGSQNTE